LHFWEIGDNVARAKRVKSGKRTIFIFTFRLPNSSRAECSQAWLEQPLCGNGLNLFIMWASNYGKAGPSHKQNEQHFSKIWRKDPPAAAKKQIKALGKKSWKKPGTLISRMPTQSCSEHAGATPTFLLFFFVQHFSFN
jgi:hypothetical protein